MIDNSDKFKNFKQTVPKKPGSLPMMPFPNVKDILLNWLEYRFKNMNLTHPIVLLGDYPSQTTLSNIPVGDDGVMQTNNLRGVSVVLLDGSVKRKGIGDVVNSKELSSDPNEPTPIEYGWHETLQIEISYWSVSSRDRDYGGDLLRTFIFEGFRIGHFLKNGLIEMTLHNYYDTSDSRLTAQNRMLSYSVSTFEFTRVFFGTLDYSEFQDAPQIQGIAIQGSFDVTQDDGKTSFGKGKGNTFLPDSASVGSFNESTEAVIVLPGGVSSIMKKGSRSSAELSLSICTEEIL